SHLASSASHVDGPAAPTVRAQGHLATKPRHDCAARPAPQAQVLAHQTEESRLPYLHRRLRQTPTIRRLLQAKNPQAPLRAPADITIQFPACRIPKEVSRT